MAQRDVSRRERSNDSFKILKNCTNIVIPNKIFLHFFIRIRNKYNNASLKIKCILKFWTLSVTITFVYWLTSAILYCRLFSDWFSFQWCYIFHLKIYIVNSQVVYNVFARNVVFKCSKLNRVTCQSDVGTSPPPMCRMCPTIG